jgi:hypothetical protein
LNSFFYRKDGKENRKDRQGLEVDLPIRSLIKKGYLETLMFNNSRALLPFAYKPPRPLGEN